MKSDLLKMPMIMATISLVLSEKTVHIISIPTKLKLTYIQSL